MEELNVGLLKDYGYIVLFLWSILEGELGLIAAGILSHAGEMEYELSVFVAGLGGFVGDQIYFYIGRYNKASVRKKLKKQRRRFAIANLLLKKYGWLIIFMQRYMYGLRTVIPLSIGVTRYSPRKYAFINLISAWVWAAITITPAYYFGEEVLNMLVFAKQHWYMVVPSGGVVLVGVYLGFRNVEVYFLQKRASRFLGAHDLG